MAATETDQSVINWPTDEGIWMANFEGVGWFPIQTMALIDDLPSPEQMRLEEENPAMAPPRRILAIVAQFPQSPTSWPYTFQSCHPAKEWRRPDAEEMTKAKTYYGVKT